MKPTSADRECLSLPKPLDFSPNTTPTILRAPKLCRTETNFLDVTEVSKKRQAEQSPYNSPKSRKLDLLYMQAAEILEQPPLLPEAVATASTTAKSRPPVISDTVFHKWLGQQLLTRNIIKSLQDFDPADHANPAKRDDTRCVMERMLRELVDNLMQRWAMNFE